VQNSARAESGHHESGPLDVDQHGARGQQALDGEPIRRRDARADRIVEIILEPRQDEPVRRFMAFLLGMISQARSPAMSECGMPPSSADVARVKIREARNPRHRSSPRAITSCWIC